METWINQWNSIQTFVVGVETWQWAIVGVFVAWLMIKPLKRRIKRLVRKSVRLIIRIARAYFIGF